jgi:hypothetical protein
MERTSSVSQDAFPEKEEMFGGDPVGLPLFADVWISRRGKDRVSPGE